MKNLALIKPLLQLGVGVLIIVLILKLTPAYDLAVSFVSIVLIPVAFLCACGLVTAATYNMASDFMVGWLKGLKDRTYQKLDAIRAEGDLQEQATIAA